MRNKYLFKLFLEFTQAYGIRDSFKNFYKYQDLFAKWLYDKSRASIEYVKLFDYMKKGEERELSIIAEFGKGIYDTVAIKMNNFTSNKAILISPYAETITSNIIEAHTGILSIENGETFVKYKKNFDYSSKPNCNPIFNDDINTLMTQVPFTKEELKPFLNLLNSDKTLFIGTCGSLDDMDKDSNIKIIKNICDSLKFVDNRNIEFCSETQNGSYLSAVKVSSKQKILKKELSNSKYL